MNIRKQLFFLYDSFKGGKLQSELLNVRTHFYNYYDEELKRQRQQRINSILSHAQKTTPFYSTVHSQKLEDFPVVDKLMIKADEDSFLSSMYNKSDLSMVTTSGSTGTPMRIYRDSAKLLRHRADNIFISEINQYEIGNRLFYTRVWNNVNKKSLLEKFVMNLETWEMSNLSDKRFDKLLGLIKKNKEPKSILGFASFFEAFASYLERNSIREEELGITSIMTMSEHLPEGARITLETALNTRCYSRYSNMENGFIANQFDLNRSYHINHGSYLVEVLHPEMDKPAMTGELGRIVVTDFFNYAMPFIRYDTGDMGIMQYSEKWGPYLEKVEGRKTDFIYNTKGELLSPHTITNTMWKYSDVKQFQFVQHSDYKYEIRLNALIKPYPGEREIENDLKPYLGSDSEIDFTYVSEIPRLRSGKVKKILNLMNEEPSEIG